MPWAIISVGIFHIKTIIPNKKERLQVLYLKAFFFHSSLFQTVGLTHKCVNPAPKKTRKVSASHSTVRFRGLFARFWGRLPYFTIFLH